MSTKLKHIITAIVLIGGIHSIMHGQEIWESRRGYLRTQGNLAPGLMKNQPRTNAYIGGDMDVFLDNQFSYAGSAWYSFSTLRPGQSGVNMNHGIFWGGAYHFAKPGRLDPYVMLQPGVGVTQVTRYRGEDRYHTPIEIVPLISASLGVNFYVSSFFHFQLRLQGVKGHITSTLPTPVSLDELRLSIGLGYQIKVRK